MKFLHTLTLFFIWIILFSSFFSVVRADEGIKTINEGGRVENLTTNGVIKTLVRSGNTIYLGGTFTQVQVIGSVAVNRTNLAAYNIDTKEITLWSPNPNNSVHTLVIDGNAIYVGGSFTTIQNTARNHIASFTKDTGVLTAWAPTIDRSVYAIAADNERVYIGGSFTKVNEQARNRFASFNKSNGDLNNWVYNIDNTITTIAVSDSNVYIGGAFTTIDDQPRNHIASIVKTTRSIIPWNPQLNEIVRNITVNNGIISMQGYHTTANRERHNYVAMFDQRTNELLSYQSYQSGILQAPNPSANPTPIPYGGIRIEGDIEIINYIAPVPSQKTNSATAAGIAAEDIMVDQKALGFKIPSLSDILTFVIRTFFVIAGLIALVYMLLGALAWITSGGDKDSIGAARDKIQAAVIGMIMIVVVLSIIWTLETVIFKRRICIGISCPLTLPGLIETTN